LIRKACARELVASRDLRILVDLGLLDAKGETRGRVYDASPALRDIYLRHYETRSHADPLKQEALPFPV
jgi:hypothetical protein